MVHTVIIVSVVVATVAASTAYLARRLKRNEDVLAEALRFDKLRWKLMESGMPESDPITSGANRLYRDR